MPETESVVPNKTSMKHIMAAVENVYGPVMVPDDDIRQRGEVIFSRHVWMYLSHEAGHSLPKIALRVKMHHTSVLHGCRKITECRNANPEFAAELDRIAARAANGSTGEREYRRKPVSVRLIRLHPDQVEEIAVLVARKMMQSQGLSQERERGVA